MFKWLMNLFENNDFKMKVRRAFKLIKNELDEHLDAINQNTNEIQGLYEIISELENKLDSLAERLEHFEMQINHDHKIILSDDEKRIFHALYLLSETKPYVSFSELQERLDLDAFVLDALINSMIAKGVRIEKHVKDGNLCYSLENKFKIIQTKNNILNIDNRLIKL